MRYLPLLLLPLCLVAGEAAQPEATGTFTYAGIRFSLLLQGPGLLATTQAVHPDPGWPHRDGVTWETRGSIAVREGVTVHLSERLVARADGGCDVDLKLESVQPVEVQTAALVVELPAADFAGRSLAYNGGAEPLPMTAGPGMLAAHWKSGISTIAVPLNGRSLVLSGDLASAVADERAWNLQRFGLRLLCARPAADRLTLATLHFRLEPGAALP